MCTYIYIYVPWGSWSCKAYIRGIDIQFGKLLRGWLRRDHKDTVGIDYGVTDRDLAIFSARVTSPASTIALVRVAQVIGCNPLPDSHSWKMVKLILSAFPRCSLTMPSTMVPVSSWRRKGPNVVYLAPRSLMMLRGASVAGKLMRRGKVGVPSVREDSSREAKEKVSNESYLTNLHNYYLSSWLLAVHCIKITELGTRAMQIPAHI